MTEYIPQGSGEYVKLPIAKDGQAVDNVVVTSVNVAIYKVHTPPPGTYPTACSYINGFWRFPVSSLIPGEYAVRAQLSGSGETGVLLDAAGTITIVP